MYQSSRKIIGKKAGVYENENGRGSFVSKCREVVDEAEKEFEALFNSIALSVDWKEKYQTISPETQKISQASFIDLFNKGESFRISLFILFTGTISSNVFFGIDVDILTKETINVNRFYY